MDRFPASVEEVVFSGMYHRLGLLKFFTSQYRKVVEEILDAVWGNGSLGDPKIVDVNVRRLRVKLEDNAQEPKHILTVWGFGYKWNIE